MVARQGRPPAMVQRNGRTPRPPEDQKTRVVDRMVAGVKSVPPNVL